MKFMKTKGFSLMEMLVVLAIFCFLLSILMPILSKVLKMAREYERMAHSKRSKPRLLVKTADGWIMGLGFYRKEPILYCDDEEIKNTHMMQHALGFQKLRDYLEKNSQAFATPHKLTEKECKILKDCGFVEYRVWEGDEDWELLKNKKTSAVVSRTAGETTPV